MFSFDVAFDAVALFANDVTISVLTPFTVFTMLAQLVVVAEDVVAAVAVVCAELPLLFALEAVPSAGNALGELELVVFAAVPSLFSRAVSSLLSFSTSTLLFMLLSVSPALVDTDTVSLSFTLFVVVVVDAKESNGEIKENK